MACAVVLIAPGPAAAEEIADVVIVNAPIYTAGPRARVQGMAIRDGRIFALGIDQEVRRHIGPITEVWDLRGGAVVPGLIDSHGHMAGLGERIAIVDLFGTKTY